MNTWILTRLGLVCCTLSLLAGCGGTQGIVSSAPAVSAPQRASSGDLVYVALYGYVVVYSYPGGKKVTTITGFHDAIAVCSDPSGNVWVVDARSRHESTLSEYAHGNSVPIAKLRLRDRNAYACAVDPSSGDLAVGTLSSNVAIFTNGAGSPKLYSTKGILKDIRTLSYDGTGDLYMSAFPGTRRPRAWLPKGGSAVIRFKLAQPGLYGWDGLHFVITGRSKGSSELLKLYNLDGSSGTPAGHVSLHQCFFYTVENFSIEGSALAIDCGQDETSTLDLYNYPAGGKPVATISGIQGSVAISVP